jgi:hypothetical protein
VVIVPPDATAIIVNDKLEEVESSAFVTVTLTDELPDKL